MSIGVELKDILPPRSQRYAEENQNDYINPVGWAEHREAPQTLPSVADPAGFTGRVGTFFVPTRRLYRRAGNFN